MSAANPFASPEICFYGDDFTGATANLVGFYRNGLSALLFLDLPTAAHLRRHPGLAALGIAGTSRALPPSEMRAEIEPAFRLFRELGSRIIQYKICSTFDSSPSLGSFGTVVDVARPLFGDFPVPVFAACPDFGRYTVFGNHFANYRGEPFRLDRHPVMAHHPATPMDEGDLRRHLERQTGRRVGLIDIRAVSAGAAAIRVAFDAAEDCAAVVIDGLDETDVDAVAAFIAELSRTRTVFTLAAQGLTHGLGRYMSAHRGGKPRSSPASIPPVERVLALSGSASPLTAIQIRCALDSGWKGAPFDVTQLLGSADATAALSQRLADTICAAMTDGSSFVLHTALGPDDPALAHSRAACERLGVPAEHLVMRIGSFFGALATEVVERLHLPRIVLAGGDTSSQAMRSIDAYGLSIAGTHAAGGSISRLYSDNVNVDGLQVLLKGGQSGSDDVLPRTLSGEGWR